MKLKTFKKIAFIATLIMFACLLSNIGIANLMAHTCVHQLKCNCYNTNQQNSWINSYDMPSSGTCSLSSCGSTANSVQAEGCSGTKSGNVCTYTTAAEGLDRCNSGDTLVCNANYYRSYDICVACPNGGTSPSGSTSLDQCSAKITCARGNYLPANSTSCTACQAPYYCLGGDFSKSSSDQGKSSCPTGYATLGAGNTSMDGCKIKCLANTFLAYPTASSCTACSSGSTSSEHYVKYGSSSSCTNSGGGGGGGGGSQDPGTDPVTGLTVKPTSWLLGIGEQKTIYPTITPSSAANKNVSFSSGNASYATVDNGGMVTGVEVGNTTVTTTTEDGGKTATTTIRVVGSNTTKQIMSTRIDGSLTRLIDATEDYIHKDQGIQRDASGSYVYSFGLGCKLGEHYCFESVEYQNQVTSISDSSTTTTLDEIKSAWNADTDNPNRWDKNGMNDGEATIATDAIKNSYYAIYKNAGKYQGKNIDVKATIVDFEPMQDERYLISNPAIVITNKEIGVAVTGIKWVKVKYEFLDSDNGEKLNLKGNTTYWDIDQNQGVIVDSDSTNQGIYFVNNGLKYNDLETLTVDNVDNQLYYQVLSDGLYIFDHNSGIDQSAKNPLYSDNLNSTAYAFTEEFEGDSITRTFQYSNPIFKNTANERVWNGHGAVYVSSTPISTENQYAIITEVENGTIDPSVAAYEGDSVTIHYSPDSGYVLSRIEIDGVKQSLSGITTEYTFKNINKDHTIKVVYVAKGLNPKTGLFEVGGILLAVAAIGGVVYFITKKKKISNI